MANRKLSNKDFVIKSLKSNGITDEYLNKKFGMTYDQLIDISLHCETSEAVQTAAYESFKNNSFSDEESSLRAFELKGLIDAIIAQTDRDKEFHKMAEEATENWKKLRNAEFEQHNLSLLKPYDEGKYKEVKTPISNKVLEEYGNNYFELITFDKIDAQNDKQVKLAGVLKEVPSFSMGCSWDKGPAATVSDTVKGYMCSPILEMTTTLGGRDRAWMSLDEGTDRVYKTTSKPSFALSFKLYTNDTIGSQPFTNYKTWIKALSLYTMPSIDAKVSINAMANNTLNGIYGTVELVDNVIDTAKNVFGGGYNTKDENGKTIVAKDKDVFSRLGDTIMKAADAAAKQITDRYDEHRVTRPSNLNNFYGAKLWYLRILPGIFKNPLIVYISNWSVTYSKELNPTTLEPIWADFTINCEMDQIASAPIWMKYLVGSSTEYPVKTKNDETEETPEEEKKKAKKKAPKKKKPKG